MSTKRFKECSAIHIHSCYSLLDALPHPKEWVFWALENGVPAINVTDHGNTISLFHCLRFNEYIAEYNQKNNTNYSPDAVIPIPGMEAYVKVNKEDKKHCHTTLIATSNEGYFNLMKLSSIAFDDTVNYHGNIKARITLDQIKEYSAGLIITTGCIASPIGMAFMADDEKLAEERFKQYVDLFGDALRVEFHPTDLTHDYDKETGGFKPFCPSCACPDGNKQKAYNRFLARMVDKFGTKAVPATDAHFIKPADKKIQDCVLQAGDSSGWRMHGSYHAHLSDEIFDMLRKHLGEWLTEERFNSWLDNANEIKDLAKTIDVKFDYHLPKIEVPAEISSKTDDYNKQTFLLLMDKIKKHGRWINTDEYKKRFEKELDVIMHNEKFNFLPYFLVFEDLCSYARSIGIMQNIGRGSAGGCLISYYLKITHIDPVKHQLPFERFLSHARIRGGSYPDIDADFSDRKPIVDYLQKKYTMGFAQISTFNKIKTKNAIKDAMWSLYGMNANHPEVRAVCDKIPDSPQGVDEYAFIYGYTDKEGNYTPGIIETEETVANFFKARPEVEEMVGKLIGLVRNWSRHASAFVISSLDLSAQRIPTMKMRDPDLGIVTVSQYDAGMVEKSGLIKADILVVKTLAATAECVSIIKQRGGPDYLEENEVGVPLIYRLPEDEAVYIDFFNKDTDSSFQFNTDLIKGYLPKFVPTKREHLSDLTALCRPGALDAPLFDTTAARYYIDVRAGHRKLEYVHPDLEPILKDTNGVITYQEQVLRFLVDIADYTWEESDIVRSAIGKKKKDVIQKTFDRIRTATLARGWTQEQADTICQQIEAFSRYSFNLSHSRCYAELGYITMYLKHHHRLEWWTSVLNVHADDEDKLRKDMRLLGPIIVPPTLQTPTKVFAIAGDKIVCPLSAVKGAGMRAVEELCGKGPFPTFEDYIERVDHVKVNAGAFAALLKARAFDYLLDNSKMYLDARADLVEKYTVLRNAKRKTKYFPPEELKTKDPLKAFVMERESNQCFNKSLIEDPYIVDLILTRWPAVSMGHNSHMPLMMKVGNSKVPVLSSVKTAEDLLKKEFALDVCMFLLYQGSTFKQGISKANKPYSLLQVQLSDGYTSIQATDWNKAAALRYPKNSLVYVRGVLKKDWRQQVSINLKEINIVE